MLGYNQISPVVHHDFAEIWRADGIIYTRFKVSVIELFMLEELRKERDKLCDGIARPDFHDMRLVKYATRNARKYFADPEHFKDVRAGAVLFQNRVQLTLGQYYQVFNKPVIPTKFFLDEKEAVEWLQRYK